MYIPKSRIDGLLETYARCGVIMKAYQSKALQVMRRLNHRGMKPGKFNRIFRKVLIHLKNESEKAKMDADWDMASWDGASTDFTAYAQFNDGVLNSLYSQFTIPPELLDRDDNTYSR